MKYILVTGGVISGIGKGIVSSSIGAILKAYNQRITAIKIDPYLNVDAGTFSPYEHGEVFVLDDGSEVDLDLGNYERFLDTELCSLNNITSGKMYQQVVNKERQGDYLGRTVQMVNHVSDAIEEWIVDTAEKAKADVCIIELGGVVGDIEGMIFIEALHQLQYKVGRKNFFCCHVSPIIRWGPSQEFKSKPTQASVKELRKSGLIPDMIVCRSELPITENIKQKIANSCAVKMHNIFNLPNFRTIYQVPIELEKQGIISSISECLKIQLRACDPLCGWIKISDIALNAEKEVVIALVGKYTSSSDCYASVIKSLEHACYDIQAKPRIHYIDSSLLEEDADQNNESWRELKDSHCLLVPGGFGIRGTAGKILAIKYARENRMPFLGICLGFQLAAIEYAQNVLGMDKAHSSEFAQELNHDLEPIVIEMLEYLDPERKLGGTMRLGLRKTQFVVEDSILRKFYDNKTVINERHRHRYEINPDYIDRLENAGLRFVGRNEEGNRMEILELAEGKHPYFVAVQFHPEYLSRPFRPSPPYKGLIMASRDFRAATPHVHIF